MARVSAFWLRRNSSDVRMRARSWATKFYYYFKAFLRRFMWIHLNLNSISF